MTYLDKKTLDLMKIGVKNYIKLNLSEGRGMKSILIGLYGKDLKKKKDKKDIPSKDVRDWIKNEWLRGAKRDTVSEFLILWRYNRILRIPVVVELWPYKYRIKPGLRTKELKGLLN